MKGGAGPSRNSLLLSLLWKGAVAGGLKLELIPRSHKNAEAVELKSELCPSWIWWTYAIGAL